MIPEDLVKDPCRARCRRVMHCDGSAHVQTVKKQCQPAFDQLLKMFTLTSGLGILLNTCFNKKTCPFPGIFAPRDRFYETLWRDPFVGHQVLSSPEI